MSDARIPATGISWFDPLRFDEPKPTDPEVEDPTEEEPAEPDTDPEEGEDPEEGDEPTGGLGDAGKRALERMKSERAAAKKEAAAEKKAAVTARRELAELTRKVQEFEDGKKSDLEKAQAQAERSAEMAAKAVARSVQSEIKVSASGQFADPSDATDVLMKDPSKYVDASGEIDTDAIEADLADLLERKPHWAKPAPAAAPVVEGEPQKPGKPKPKPDPGQGSRGAPAPIDYRTASKEELAAELANYRYRQRSL